jgi:FixJ family two-component response regulator
MRSEESAGRLAILDDDKPFQSALQDLMESEGISALCFDSAEQFLHSKARHEAACLIVDICMPGMSGIELQAHLKAERSRIPIIFLTGGGDISSAVNAMKQGASDFLTKPVAETVLLAAIEHALEEAENAARKNMEETDLRARYHSLTRREREVLPLIVSGLLNKQVGAELGITEYTVQVHRGHIMRKMKADSFATLVRMADRLSPYGAGESGQG